MLTPSTGWVYLAAALQLLQLPTMALLRRRLRLSDAVANMPPLARAYSQAMSIGIVWYVSGMAVVLLLEPAALLNSTLGVAICRLHALAWLTRCVHHWRQLGPRWPVHQARWLLWSTGVIYSCLALLFGWFSLG